MRCLPVTTQGWTGQGMTHKQQVCRKSGSRLHKVSGWSTRGLGMCNVNTNSLIYQFYFSERQFRIRQFLPVSGFIPQILTGNHFAWIGTSFFILAGSLSRTPGDEGKCVADLALLPELLRCNVGVGPATSDALQKFDWGFSVLVEGMFPKVSTLGMPCSPCHRHILHSS